MVATISRVLFWRYCLTGNPMVLSGEKSTSCQDTYHITWCDQVMESVVLGGLSGWAIGL